MPTIEGDVCNDSVVYAHDTIVGLTAFGEDHSAATDDSTACGIMSCESTTKTSYCSYFKKTATALLVLQTCHFDPHGTDTLYTSDSTVP